MDKFPKIPTYPRFDNHVHESILLKLHEKLFTLVIQKKNTPSNLLHFGRNMFTCVYTFLKVFGTYFFVRRC